MLIIATRVAFQKTRYAWEQMLDCDVLHEVNEGQDQDMLATHHNVDEEDLDFMVDEFKSLLSPEPASLLENNGYHQDPQSF